MNIKRLSFAMLLSLALLNSCVESTLDDDTLISPDIEVTDQTKIEIIATVEDGYTSTKGTPITDGAYVNTIGIYSYWFTYANKVLTSTQELLPNSQIARNSFDKLEFLEVAYWPVLEDTQTLGFIAYSPFTDVVSSEDDSSITGTTTSSGLMNVESNGYNHLELDYYVPETISNQPDLLYSKPVEQAVGAVGLTFKHALATVVFNVIGDGVQPVSKITVTNVGRAGHMKLEYPLRTDNSNEIDSYDIVPEWTLYHDADGKDFVTDFVLGVADEFGNSLVEVYPNDEELTTICAASGYLMMIPQTVSTFSEIIIEFEGGGSRSVRFLDEQVWAPGGLYNYNITIDFEGEVVDFSNVATVNSLVGYDEALYGERTTLETANCYILNAPVYTKEQEEAGKADDAATASLSFTRTEDADGATSTDLYGALYYIPISSRMEEYYEEYVTTEGSTVPEHTGWEPVILWYDCETDPLKSGVMINRVGNSASGEERFSVYIPYEYTNFGNVVIGVKDDGGNIIWSWHLWITDYNPYYNYTLGYDAKADGTSAAYAVDVEGGELHHYRDTEVRINGVTSVSYWQNVNFYRNRLMMDRNLGAMNNENCVFGETDDTGLFYQFGRKDALPRGTNYAVGKGNKDYYVVAGPKSVDWTIEHPVSFYSGTYYWCDVVESTCVWNDNRYTAAKVGADPGEYFKSIFDPSPIGFMVPTINVWNDFVSTNVASTTITRTTGTTGIIYKSESGLEARYPMVNILYHTTGVYAGAGTGGSWSSTPIDNNSAKYLYYDNGSTITPYAISHVYGYKATANTVRPIQRWYGPSPNAPAATTATSTPATSVAK